MQQHDKIQEKTIKHKKTKPKVSQIPRSKTHIGYWDGVIFQRRPGGNWHAQIGYRGRQQKVSLSTPVKSAAAARARDFYLALITKGWSEALAELKPESTRRSSGTVGEFLDELQAKAELSP